MVERLTDTPGSLVPTCRHTHVHPAERRSSPPGWAPGAQPVPVLTHVVSSRDTMSVLPAQLPVRSWNQACHPQRQACGLLCCRRERPTHCSLPLVSVPELSRTRSSPSEYSGNTITPFRDTCPLSCGHPPVTSHPFGRSSILTSGEVRMAPLEILPRPVSIQARLSIS